jgi:ESSS subunit of NADH:ubiquinone oxidoreductase (complex I)
VKEDWENIWYIGMFGTMAFAAVILYYKPDTRCVITYSSEDVFQIKCASIQTWALKEAKERMEARGEKYQYEPSSSS